MVARGDDGTLTQGTPKKLPAQQREGEHSVAPSPSLPRAEAAQSGRRGDLPLLIQGLLEQLPDGRQWTRKESENWIAMAKMAFEVVYDLEPESGDRGRDLHRGAESAED